MRVLVINEVIDRANPFGHFIHAIREVDSLQELFLGRGYALDLANKTRWYKQSVTGSILVMGPDAVPAEYRTYALLINP